MRCPNCGQELRSDDKFCANCGAPAPLETSPDPYGDPYGDPYAQQPRPPLPSFDIQTIQKQAAAQRSFTSQAVITLVLYWILWIPGLIANLIFWNEANNVERVTGKAPEGKGCLVALFIVFTVLPILVGCFWVVIAIAAA